MPNKYTPKIFTIFLIFIALSSCKNDDYKQRLENLKTRLDRKVESYMDTTLITTNQDYKYLSTEIVDTLYFRDSLIQLKTKLVDRINQINDSLQLEIKSKKLTAEVSERLNREKLKYINIAQKSIDSALAKFPEGYRIFILKHTHLLNKDTFFVRIRMTPDSVLQILKPKKALKEVGKKIDKI
ncbi:MAG: hypothetical protein SGJ04_08515 [Bacteroidota bacterium]|nr:hypothetical protein [Bacteroidota bacterium]